MRGKDFAGFASASGGYHAFRIDVVAVTSLLSGVGFLGVQNLGFTVGGADKWDVDAFLKYSWRNQDFALLFSA